jgi:hypothetical protein
MACGQCGQAHSEPSGSRRQRSSQCPHFSAARPQPNNSFPVRVRAFAWQASGMHAINGVRDPAASFPLSTVVDDHGERQRANRAVAVSAAGLAVTGLVELAFALVSGSVALLGDALHNLSDVSTSLLVFVGFRASRKTAAERYPYGYEKAEDLAGIGVALAIWASAAFAGAESINKLIHHGTTRPMDMG